MVMECVSPAGSAYAYPYGATVDSSSGSAWICGLYCDTVLFRERMKERQRLIISSSEEEKEEEDSGESSKEDESSEEEQRRPKKKK